MSEKRKIAFHGGYGMSNFGDDIFLQILIRYFSKNFRFNDFTVFASFPENVNKMFLNDEFNGRVHAVNMRNFLKVIKEIAKSKVLVLGPGEIGCCKYKYEVKNVAYILFLVLAAKLLCTKVVFLGIGHIKPKYTVGDIFQRIYYALADKIIVRDDSSYRLLSKYNKTYLLPVVSFLLLYILDIKPEALQTQQGERSRNVILILRNLEFMGKNLEKKYANLLEMLVKDDISVTLLILSKVPTHISYEARVADDKILAEQIISKIDKKYSERIRIVEFDLWNISNVQKVLEIVSSSDIVVSNRLHGCILATLLSKKLIILSYAEKMNMYAKQTGLKDDFILDIERGDLDERLLYNNISKLLSTNKINYDINKVENMVKESKGFDRILKEVLK